MAETPVEDIIRAINSLQVTVVDGKPMVSMEMDINDIVIGKNNVQTAMLFAQMLSATAHEAQQMIVQAETSRSNSALGSTSDLKPLGLFECIDISLSLPNVDKGPRSEEQD